MTISVAEPRTVPAALVGDLLLARRMPPAKRPPTLARVRADVACFFRAPPSDERWQETIDGLVHAGLLTLRPLRLTDSGRSRALAFLGVRELPPRCDWERFRRGSSCPKRWASRRRLKRRRRRLKMPIDVETIHQEAREAFGRLLNRAAGVELPPHGKTLLLLGESPL